MTPNRSSPTTTSCSRSRSRPNPSPDPDGSYGPTTTVVEVDLSNPDDLRIAGSLTLDGNYISARSIGDTARIAVTTPPTQLGFLYPSSPERRGVGRRGEPPARARDDGRGLGPGLLADSADGSQSDGALVDCASIHAPAEFAGFDMLSVVTLPMDESLAAPAATTSIMATGDTVYASQDRMYISTNEWVQPTFDEQERGVWEENYQTGIHRFALPADGAAVYEASGTVDGHLLNQFSMHDRDGTFFVATTTGTPWSSQQSESQIVAMQPNGEVLEQIGQVGGLGKGEQIFSVRYVDDTAYVVTFRQTDPFYVVDLSSPTDMVVRGELKIPGVSNYLHPISDTLVLGVGQDATDDGRQTGSKVSLFDVSDPGDPREVDVWTLPGAVERRRVRPPCIPLVGADLDGRAAARVVVRPVRRCRGARGDRGRHHRAGPDQPARRRRGADRRDRLPSAHGRRRARPRRERRRAVLDPPGAGLAVPALRSRRSRAGQPATRARSSPSTSSTSGSGPARRMDSPSISTASIASSGAGRTVASTATTNGSSGRWSSAISCGRCRRPVSRRTIWPPSTARPLSPSDRHAHPRVCVTECDTRRRIRSHKRRTGWRVMRRSSAPSARTSISRCRVSRRSVGAVERGVELVHRRR